MLSLRRLQVRIALFFLGLLLLVLALSFWWVDADIRASAQHSLAREMQAGQLLVKRWPGLAPGGAPARPADDLSALRTISGLEVARAEWRDGGWVVDGSTLPASAAPAIAAALDARLDGAADEADLGPVSLGPERYAARAVVIDAAPRRHAIVLLGSQRRALEPYRELQRTLAIAAALQSEP